jgi:Carbohydrate family 9 binding domain-like
MKKQVKGKTSGITGSKMLIIRNMGGLSLVMVIIVGMLSCNKSPGTLNNSSLLMPPKPDPKSYVAYRTTSPVSPDGIIDEKDWEAVLWTDYFVDIEGSVKPEPRFKTRTKMLWDDMNLYIAAELLEPHIWATLKQRDTIIFIDHDFEVFIDPDGDTQSYYELEVNAFGTAWDLFLQHPYRDGRQAIFAWDIAGLKVGTHINGTINNPNDVDKSWTVELVLPLSVLRECNGNRKLPEAGDQWRINFSRVEWHTVIENGTYKKEIDPKTNKRYREDNWVWSPQGRINMHMPEMWGFLQFSSIEAGAGTEEFVSDNELDLKWALRMIYYAENEYYKEFGIYSSSLDDIGLSASDFPDNLPAPVIQSTRTTFESYFPVEDSDSVWTIYNHGRLIKI